MKKFIFVFIFAVLIFSAASVCAKETASLPEFDVTLNEQSVKSDFRQFPLVVYKDITYVPMTYYDCRYLGLTTKWDNDTRTLYIDKGYITCAYRDYAWQWQNGNIQEISLCDFNIVVNGKEIDNSKEEYPLLVVRDVTYFPLTWRFAVEEFGWQYSFDSKEGLNITSDNYHCENIYLPNMTGSVAADDKYYYYSGMSGEKHVVYRVPQEDTKNPEIILELKDSPRTTGASFIVSGDDIYIAYFAGYTGITGSSTFYKINADGSVTEETPQDHYQYGKHGRSEYRMEKDGIKLHGVNEYVDGPTDFYYEIDGVEHKAQNLPGRVRVGRRRNGIYFTDTSFIKCTQIYDGKIYYTAVDLDGKEDSALYCIDTKTGENKKIIDGVCGFYVYTGWLNEQEANSTMIVYDQNGSLMRYSLLTDEVITVEQGNPEDGLVLDVAAGGIDIYTVQKTIGGNRCVVKKFSCYANGTASINGVVLMDTTTGTTASNYDGKLCVTVFGEAPQDSVRFMVLGDGMVEFMSSDTVSDVYIRDDTLYYKIGKEILVKTELKQ